MTSEIATVVGPTVLKLIPSFLDKCLLPKINEFNAKRKHSAKINAADTSGLFHDFYFSEYNKHSNLKTIVFRNNSIPLEDIYIPLTLSGRMSHGLREWRVESFDEDFFESWPKILITDEAGMGKSTLSRFLFLKAVEESTFLPLFIELRHLDGKTSVVDYILKRFNALRQEHSRELIADLIEKGSFLFFLDGYDEIPYDIREDVTFELQEFVAYASNNVFVLTSRSDRALSSFSDFHCFFIKPLAAKDAFTLLERYGKYGGAEKHLILEARRQYGQLREYMTNPMLVSLIYLAYEASGQFPFKKHAFYRQVFDALYDKHDFSKPLFQRPKLSKLTKDQFEAVLRALGFLMAKKGTVGGEKEEILRYIHQARKFAGIQFECNDFLEDLSQAVPLFAAEGSYYRWKHKSLCDYFAAAFIARDAQEKRLDILAGLVSGAWHNSNVLWLVGDLDFRTYSRVVLGPVLRQFVQYFDESFQHGVQGVSKELLERRKSVCFLLTWVVVIEGSELMDGSDVGWPVRNDMVTLRTRLKELFPLQLPGSVETQVGMYSVSLSVLGYGEYVAQIVGNANAIGIADLAMNDGGYVYTDSSKMIAEIASYFPDVHEFVFDEDPENPVNHPQVFEQFTILVEMLGRCNLDYHKVRTFLDRMDEEGSDDILDPFF